MARTLTKADKDYLYNASVPARTSPFTAAGWVSGMSTTGIQPLIGDGVNHASGQAWCLRGDGGTMLYTVWASGDVNFGYSITTALTHYALTVNGTTATLFVNGVNTANGTVTAASYRAGISIGSFDEGGGFVDHTAEGNFSWWGLWSAELSAAEIASLADGMHPTLIRPASLTDAWDLYGNSNPEPGWKGYAMTFGNTPTKAAQPRQYLRSKSRARRFPTTAAPPDEDELSLSLLGVGN